jgi:hypothetical protein
MAKIEDLYIALQNADKAGDVEAARKIATLISEATNKGGRSVSAQAVRGAELASRGFLSSLGETVGAIPELAASGLRSISPSLAPEPGYYNKKIKDMGSAVGETISAPFAGLLPSDVGNFQPETQFERGAYGAGRGAADAASCAIPGRAVAKGAQAGSLAQRVGSTLAAQPVLLAAAGTTAGAVQGATGNELYGLGAGLTVGGLPSMVSRGVSPVTSQLSTGQQQLAQRAIEKKIPLTAGQATGSPTLNRIESTFAQLPFTSKSQLNVYDAQRKAFNREVLNFAGINADEASPAIIDDAYRVIGKEFNDLAKATTLRPDQRFIDDVVTVAKDDARRLTADQAPVLKSYIDDFMDMHKAMNVRGQPSTVQIEGREYQKLSSKIKRRARSATDPELKASLNKMASSLDDLMERSSSKDMADLWKDARRRYKNLLTIDKAVSSSGSQADRSSFNIPYSGLKSAVQSMDKSGYARGRGDLNEMSRIGDFLGAQRIPDSGTTSRGATAIGLTGGGGLAGSAALTGDIVTPAIVAGTALTLPKAGQLMYNSPIMQAYLRNQLSSGGPSRDAATILGKIGAANQLGEYKQNGLLRTPN